MAEHPPIITRYIPNREPLDCGIVALAMYLNQTYEDVLRAASDVDRKDKARNGLYEAEIRKIALILGFKLRKKKNVNLEEDFGLLCLPEHIAVLRNGLLLDTDGLVWDVDDYLKHYNYAPTGLLYLGDC